MSAQTSQQIADWLEKLGMSEYAQRFVRLNPPHGRVLPVTTRHEAALARKTRAAALTAVSGKSLISIKLTTSPQL
jgi:hypothetical protein